MAQELLASLPAIEVAAEKLYLSQVRSLRTTPSSQPLPFAGRAGAALGKPVPPAERT